jgi:hypothetical protein
LFSTTEKEKISNWKESIVDVTRLDLLDKVVSDFLSDGLCCLIGAPFNLLIIKVFSKFVLRVKSFGSNYLPKQK